MPHSKVNREALARVRRAAGRGTRITLLAVVTSTGLAAVKVLTGLLGNSYALIADGMESLLDIVSALVVWGGLRAAAAPPTERHPYGYGKVEPLAALVVSFVLLVAAVGLAIQSVREILTPHHMPATFTLYVLVGVVFTKEILFRTLRRRGGEIGSGALVSDAWHHRSDAITSLAAFVGISVALLMGPGWEAADDWAALLACGVIAFNGIRLFRSAWREVLDVAPSPLVVATIRSTAAARPGVVEIETCRVRKSGLGLFCDLHVVVDGTLTVSEGHRISHDVKDALLALDVGILDVLVHIEPAG